MWLVVAAGIAAFVATGVAMVGRGFSARDQPSAVETFIARRARSMAVPARERGARNPVPLTPEGLAEARAHFADHCALCHANDGTGQTDIGKNLYPKAPDMRLENTQRLTDGELYYIIKNGVRLTGMPAWGDPGDAPDEDTWNLVHLIRHLHEITPEQLREMEAMNPRSPIEIENERLDREFLQGGSTPEAPAKPKPPSHIHR